jgi:hypothetical protein
LLITLHKGVSNDATMLDASFCGRLSTSKRITALANNNLFASFYMIAPNKRVHPIFQPQCCILTDPDTGAKHEYSVSHGSNKPRFLRAEFAPVEVAGTLICLIDISSTKVPACYRSGPAFTTTNVTGTITLDLHDGVTYKAVHLPLSLPIPFGINDTTKDTLSESSMDILDTTFMDGAFWAWCLLAHDKPRLDDLVHCTSEGIGRVGNRLILPRLLTGQSWGQPLACKVTLVSDDKEEETKPTMDALTACLAKITDLAARSMAPPATVATTPDDFDSLDLVGTAATTPSIPRKLGASTIQPAPKDTPLNEKLCERAKLAYLGWDHTAKSLHLPMLTENGKWIYCSPDRASINEAMANMFANIPEALAQSTDFLHHEVDLRHHNPLVYAQNAKSY